MEKLLTPRERAIRALMLEEADRVPIGDLCVDPPLVESITGEKLGMKRSTMERDLRTLIKCYRRLDFDVFVFYPSYWYAQEDFTYLNSKTYVDPWGAVRRELPFPCFEHLYIDGSIKNMNDIEKFVPPDAEEIVDTIVAAEKTLREIAREMLLVAGAVGGFIIHLEMRGIAHGLSDYYLNPRLPEKVMEMVHRYNMELIESVVDCGAEAVLYDDDYADSHGPMLPPHLWKRFCKPVRDDFLDRFKKDGLFTFEHCDGNLMPIIEDIVTENLHCLNPIQPQAMDIGDVKERYGNKICLMGNIDCGETLVHGSQQDITEAVRNCIRLASSGGGHILSTSNSIHWGIPPRNVSVMIEAAKKYGLYTAR